MWILGLKESDPIKETKKFCVYSVQWDAAWIPVSVMKSDFQYFFSCEFKLHELVR